MGLTSDQQLAVENRGGTLLVSAAAGSGKTRVLVERLLSYLLDPRDPGEYRRFSDDNLHESRCGRTAGQNRRPAY